LNCEAKKGYPFHIWLAIGHLAEAEDECLADFPELSEKIRPIRLALMGQEGQFKNGAMMDLLIAARRIAEQINGVSEEQRIDEILKFTDGCKG
jgi:hypothetical protein